MLRIRGYTPGLPRTPENEREVDVPPSLVPGVTDLDIPDFLAYRERVKCTPGDQIRVQTRRRYNVSSDQDFYDRYRDGGPRPSEAELADWGEYLEAERAAGNAYRNVHVVNGDIGLYLAYQFEWAYQYNVIHGQQVRIVDVAETPAAAAVLWVGDFWVLEHRHVVLGRYDDQDRYLGVVGVDASGKHGYLAVAEMVWELGTDFTTWWAEHPRYHRAVNRAT